MSKKYDKFLRNEQWIYQKYWGEELSQQQIADIVGCCRVSVLYAFKQFSIPCRSFSEAGKGEKNPMFGKHHTKEANQKNRLKHLGKKLSEEHKRKIRGALIGEKSYWYGKHPTEEHKRKIREARKHQKFPKHHTKPELIFEEICKKHNLPFKYTGNGDFWIHNINPDFVEVNGKKIAVEIFGDYWHSPLLRRNMPYNQSYEGRKGILKKYGWELIVFWETDLLREDAEQFVLSELGKHKVF